MNLFYNILSVAAGSALGGTMRFVVARFIQEKASPSSFPFGTLAVNIIGCFMLGIIIGAAGNSSSVNQRVYLFLTVGFCGGFTTFSTFISENFTLSASGDFLISAAYTAISLIAGLLALSAGLTLAGR